MSHIEVSTKSLSPFSNFFLVLLAPIVVVISIIICVFFECFEFFFSRSRLLPRHHLSSR